MTCKKTNHMIISINRSHFLKMENEFKVFTGNSISFRYFCYINESLGKVYLLSLQYLYIIQNCRSNLLREAHLAYPGGRINYYSIKQKNPPPTGPGKFIQDRFF